MDVQWIAARNEFWALYNVKIAGSCATPAVFLATSPDGVNWTPRNQPLLAKGSILAFADVVYRSTLSYDPISDDIIFWYSGARYDGHAYVWSAAVQHRAREDVFNPSNAISDPGPLLVPPPAEFGGVALSRKNQPNSSSLQPFTRVRVTRCWGLLAFMPYFAVFYSLKCQSLRRFLRPTLRPRIG